MAPSSTARGAAFRRRAVRPRRPYAAHRTALWIYAGVFYFFLYGPLLMIVLLSFNESEIVGFPFVGFTTHWYGVVFESPALGKALGNSLGVGILAAGIATSLALALAMGFRHPFRGKTIILYLILVPIIIPGIIGGIVLLIFFGYSGVRSSLYTTVLVAHVNWVLPFAFLTLYPRLHGFDRALEEAAMDLGAPPWKIFTRIVFPIVRPGVLASLLFGALYQGGSELDLEFQTITRDMLLVIQGLIILFSGALAYMLNPPLARLIATVAAHRRLREAPA